MGGIASLIADPEFAKLAPADKRMALTGVTGDKTFSTLSDGDTRNFIAKFNMAEQAPALDRFTNPPHPGFLRTALSDIGGMIKGAPQMFKALAPPIAVPGMGMATSNPEDISAPARQAVVTDEAAKAAGHGLPYRAAAQIASVAGTNVPAMQQSAETGDIGGVLGHAAAPMAVVASPFAVEGSLRLANRVIPSTARAGAGLSALTDSPEGAFAQ